MRPVQAATITAYIPSVHRRIVVPWADYENKSAKVFFRNIITTLGSRYAFLRQFILLNPQGMPVASMEQKLSIIASPGDELVLSTPDELRAVSQTRRMSTRRYTFSRPQGPPLTGIAASPPTPSTEEILSEEYVMPAWRLPGRRMREQLRGRYNEDDATTSLPGIFRIFREFLSTGIDQFGPTTFAEQLASLGPVPPATAPIKTVITTQTFHRVCSVVHPPLVREEEDVICPLEDDDTVGGPQDAGLGGCSICLSLLAKTKTVEPQPELRQMPRCCHVFHTTCLHEWLTQSAITCPVCRQPAVTERCDYGYLGMHGDDPARFTPADTMVSSRPRPAGAAAAS